MIYLVDTIIILIYLLTIIALGVYFSRKYRVVSEREFMTGGHHLPWWKTGLTLVALMFDPGIMGNTALAYVWGYYVIQWNGVNVWFSAWFASLFIIGIYWRSGITNTPEYLEKRFNPATRAVFSIIMVIMLVSFMTYGVFMGSVMLNKLLGWNHWLGAIALLIIASTYVIMGGVRTMLALDVIQGGLLIITLLVLGGYGFYLLGGFEGIRQISELGRGNTPIPSMIPPMDTSLCSKIFFPLPAIPTWAVIAGLSWIVCNSSMAQRLLASRDEQHSQKALIMAGGFNVFVLFFAYTAGVAMRKLEPSINSDEAFITLLLEYFPVGVRGFLMIGLVAALLSTIDGLLSTSGQLLNDDIYKRFIHRSASPANQKHFTQIVQIVFAGVTLLTMPLFMQSSSNEQSAFQVLLDFLGDIMGVVIAIFVLGIFFKRTTAKASFIAITVGIVLGWFVKFNTELNFAYRGTLQFLLVILLGLVLCRFEKPRSKESLANLTIWTLPDVKGPFIGLKAWPGLLKWVIGLPLGWLILMTVWEIYMRSA